MVYFFDWNSYLGYLAALFLALLAERPLLFTSEMDAVAGGAVSPKICWLHVEHVKGSLGDALTQTA